MVNCFVKKGTTVDQYIGDLTKPGFKFDELALLIFTQMYHKHIFVGSGQVKLIMT